MKLTFQGECKHEIRKLARLRHWTTCWLSSSADPYILCPQMGHGVLEHPVIPLAPLPCCRWWWPFSGVPSRSSARRLRALALTRLVRLIRMRWNVLSRLREWEISFVSMRDAFIRFQTIYLPTSILFTFLNLRRGGWCRHAGRTDAAATGAGCVVMMRRWTKCAWNAFKTFQFLDEMHFQIGRSQRDATYWAARRIQWRLLPAYSNWMEIYIFIIYIFFFNSSYSVGR